MSEPKRKCTCQDCHARAKAKALGIAIAAAKERVVEAADQWEADQGDCVDYEIELAKAVRNWREARTL